MQCCKFLLKEVSNVDSRGKTALMYAIEANNIEIVELLKEAEENISDNMKTTCLMYAASVGN